MSGIIKRWRPAKVIAVKTGPTDLTRYNHAWLAPRKALAECPP
jgi:hypothetical protein